VDALVANLSHGGGATQFELALLAEFGATASRLAALMATFSSDTLMILMIGIHYGEKETKTIISECHESPY